MKWNQITINQPYLNLGVKISWKTIFLERVSHLRQVKDLALHAAAGPKALQVHARDLLVGSSLGRCWLNDLTVRCLNFPEFNTENLLVFWDGTPSQFWSCKS